MEKKRKITQYRERLDSTLASAELTNEETLKTLVKNQLLRSSQHENEECIQTVVETRTSEVSNFLDMLRSASVNDHELSKSTKAAHGEWKLKQDTEEFRVMYREGPQGTPFHTLLAEGYVDGPLDVCLCVSWESALFKKWWPQSNIPPFKIINCKCLQKVRMGEQIIIVSVKVMWPVSAREAVVHYFLFEYFQDDLVVALFNTIPDLESIDKSVHGFTNDGIPEAKDVVRIGLVGGFALQKVTPERSYFRTIATMDVKLDFVPPALINFLSRQLIGNGFKLYQKSVASVSTDDEDYGKALGDPLFTHIRKALYSIDEPNGDLDGKELNSDTSSLPVQGMPDDLGNMEQKVHNNDCASKSLPKNDVAERKVVGEIEEAKSEESRHTNDDTENMESKVHSDDRDDMETMESKVHSDDRDDTESSLKSAQVTDRKAFGEIEEEESEDSIQIEGDEEGDKHINQPSTNKNEENCHVKGKKEVSIRPEVEQALGILEKAISMIREYGFNAQTRSSAGFINEEPPMLDKGEAKVSTSLEDGGVCSNGEISKKDTVERVSHDSMNSSGIHDSGNTGSNSYSREVNHNRIAPASPEEFFTIPIETNQVTLSSPKNGTTEIPTFDQTRSTEPNGIHENSINEGKKLYQQKKYRFCCFPFNSDM